MYLLKDHDTPSCTKLIQSFSVSFLILFFVSGATALGATLYSGFDVKVPGTVANKTSGPGAQKQDPCKFGFDKQDKYIEDAKTNLDTYYNTKIAGFKEGKDLNLFETTETKEVYTPFALNCGPGQNQSCYCNPADDEFIRNSWNNQSCGTPMVVSGNSLVWNGSTAGSRTNAYVMGIRVQAMKCYKEKAKKLLDEKQAIPALISYETLAEDTKKITEKAMGTAFQARRYIELAGENVTNFCAATEDAKDCSTILSRAPSNLDNAAKSRVAACHLKSAVEGNVASFNYLLRGYVTTMASHAFTKLWLDADSIIRQWLNNPASLTKQCVNAAVRAGERYGKKKRSKSKGKRRAIAGINNCLASDIPGKDVKKILEDYLPDNGDCKIGPEL